MITAAFETDPTARYRNGLADDLAATDVQFSELFARRPDIAAHIDPDAAAIANSFVEQVDPSATPDALGKLGFATKKLMTIFTNLDDYKDQASQTDFAALFSHLYAQSGHDMAVTAQLLDEYVFHAVGKHIPALSERIRFWYALPHSARFWAVLGAAFSEPVGAPAPTIPTQANRS